MSQPPRKPTPRVVVVLAEEALEATAQAALAAGASGVLAKDGSAQIPKTSAGPTRGEVWAEHIAENDGVRRI